MSRVVSVGVESDAVVIDDKLDLVAFRHQMQSYDMGQGVFHDVLQRLLGNPVERFFCREVYLGFRFGHELDVELVPCSDGRGEATQPGDKPFLGNALRPQSEDQRAKLHKRRLGLIDDVVERLDQPLTLGNPSGRPSRSLSRDRYPLKC